MSPMTERWRPTLSASMLMAALLVPRIAEGVYEGLGRELPPTFELLANFWFIVSLAVWFWTYCRTHRVPWVFDMGWFVLLAWLVIVPYYVIRRERWTGVLRMALFLFAIVVAVLVRWLTAVAVYAVV